MPYIIIYILIYVSYKNRIIIGFDNITYIRSIRLLRNCIYEIIMNNEI